MIVVDKSMRIQVNKDDVEKTMDLFITVSHGFSFDGSGVFNINKEQLDALQERNSLFGNNYIEYRIID